MQQSRKVVTIVYLAIAVVALIACWRQNIAFMSNAGTSLLGGFIQFWPALLANHATTSITIDSFLFGLAALVWMVFEARSLGIRFVWLYVILAFVIAISVTFPLFLFARERRLEELGRARNEAAPTAFDVAGLAIVGIPIVVFALYTLTH
jgi:hypothetical protein